MYYAPQQEWSIELLRGIAALMVVFAHYYALTDINPGLLTFSFSGVDLFFVISGFVFAPYIFGKKFIVIPFLIRRFFRIYPLYLAALLFYVILHLFQDQEVKYVLAHLFFLHTMESKEIAFYYNPAFWSLPPEVEFYLFLPLWLLVAKHFRHYAMIVLIALITHLLIAYKLPSTPDTINSWTVYSVHLPGILIEFLLGSFVWFIVVKSPRLIVRIMLILAGLLIWLFLAHFFASGGNSAISSHPVFRGNMGLFAAIAFSLIACGWIGLIKSPSKWLYKLAIMLGNLSYGIYLFHNAIPIALKELSIYIPGNYFVLTCFLVTLSVAFLFHTTVESPFRKLGRSWASQIEASKTKVD